jgi:hypothetical protein
LKKIQPKGVFIVGLLTVLSALTIGFLAFQLWTYGTSNAVRSTPEDLIIVALIGGFGVLILADAILIFRGVRAGWYLSIALWIVLLAYALMMIMGIIIALIALGRIAVNQSNWVWFILFFVCPLLYPVICLVYFLRKSVREYFGT